VALGSFFGGKFNVISPHFSPLTRRSFVPAAFTQSWRSDSSDTVAEGDRSFRTLLLTRGRRCRGIIVLSVLIHFIRIKNSDQSLKLRKRHVTTSRSYTSRARERISNTRQDKASEEQKTGTREG
jgi:hypothetical protein